MINEHKIRKEICDIGDRIYKKGFAAANDGNISYRVGENRVICTPTMINKGYMKPEDLCVVDMEGNQLSGRRPRTSEIFIHLTIMKERPEIKSVVHCHPPHATAFGIAREPIPQGVLPEVEIFLGNVPVAAYAIPGGQEFADTVLPFVHKANVIVLANHGTISFGETVEHAYWWTEVLEAYCRILMISHALGRVNYFSREQMLSLLELKKGWGFEDARLDMPNVDLLGNDAFRDTWKDTGVKPVAFQPPPCPAQLPDSSPAPTLPVPTQPAPIPTEPASLPMPASSNGVASMDQEVLIRTITDRVMAALSQRA